MEDLISLFVDNNNQQTEPHKAVRQIIICENTRIGKFANYIVESYGVQAVLVGGQTGRCGECHVASRRSYRVDKKPYAVKIMTKEQIEKLFGHISLS